MIIRILVEVLVQNFIPHESIDSFQVDECMIITGRNRMCYRRSKSFWIMIESGVMLLDTLFYGRCDNPLIIKVLILNNIFGSTHKGQDFSFVAHRVRESTCRLASPGRKDEFALLHSRTNVWRQYEFALSPLPIVIGVVFFFMMEMM